MVANRRAYSKGGQISSGKDEGGLGNVTALQSGGTGDVSAARSVVPPHLSKKNMDRQRNKVL